MVDFCEMEDLIMCNTCFQHKVSAKSTWSSLDKSDVHQIDYILCSRSVRGLLFDSKSCPATIFRSDHFLIVAKVSVARFRGRGQEDNKKKKSPQDNRPLKRELLIESELKKEEFANKFTEKIKDLSRDGTVKEVWENAIRCMKGIAVEVVGHVEK